MAQKKTTRLMKLSVWQKLDQERTNQNARRLLCDLTKIFILFIITSIRKISLFYLNTVYITFAPRAIVEKPLTVRGVYWKEGAKSN